MYEDGVAPQLGTLHTLFKEACTELAQAIEEIVERIAPLEVSWSLSEFAALTFIRETGALAADAMISQPLSDHTTASRDGCGGSG